MKIIVSKEEIEKVKKYCLFVDTNPCRGCSSNNGFCQGCSKAISWESSAKALRDELKDIIGDNCPGGEAIKKYCQTEISLTKLQAQRAQLNQQIFKVALKQARMLDREIEIKEDTENDD